MLRTYLEDGIRTLIILIPICFFIICVFHILKFLIKRKFEFNPLRIFYEFSWILITLAILFITGVISGDYGNTSLFGGNARLSFKLFEDGISTATILNLILFIPFGFFSASIFKKLRSKSIYGILIGAIFSILIEFTQTFTGRLAELDDVLMNTLGTFIGYKIFMLLLKRKNKSLIFIKNI